MPAAFQPVSEQAGNYLDLILEKVERIESRLLSSPSRGKIYDLARDRILHHLIPHARQYAVELLDLRGFSISPGDVVPSPLDAHHRPRVEQFIKHFREVVELTDLLQAREDSPDFDELDAYHAESFIVNREASHNHREAANNHRVAIEMERLMRVGDLEPVASEGSPPVGLPGHVAPEVSPALGQALSNLTTLVHEQSKPRYIHKYLDEEPPYQRDNQTVPTCGSYGVISKATSKYTGDVVAIKTISDCFSPQDRLRVVREVGVLEVCDHPNLIQIVDAYETPDDSIHLVLKPWAPFTLHKFLAMSEVGLKQSCPWYVPGQPASMDIILRILCGLVEGLYYLHLKFIKHKDIKPENILLHRGIWPIIADFGTSKVFNTGNPTNYTDSTYSYLAPEQNKKTGSSLESDVWQLGCCFAMTLTRACGGDTAVFELQGTYADHSGNIAMDVAQFLPMFRRLCASMPEVFELICGMLEEDPAMRWTIVQVRAELARVVGERLGQN